MVEGGAGTGKTILAIFLVKLLTDLANGNYEVDDNTKETDVGLIQSLLATGRKPKIGFVVPMQSLRTTIRRVFNSIHGLSSTMVLSPMDVPRLGKDEPFDLLICDEAHRLRRRWAMNGFDFARFDRNNDLLGFSHDKTELDWIMRCSRMQLLFYDPDQSIKPTDIPRSYFADLINRKSRITLQLKSQLRCKGGNDYIDYVKKVLKNEDPEPIRQFADYDIRFFDNVDEMADSINEKNREVGLSCLVAGYAWKWKTKGQKNPVERDIDIGRGYIWNRAETDWIYSSPFPYEVGCIHTTQGYDLNYVGVIFGPEIIYDPEKERIDVIRENYMDEKATYVSGDHAALREFIIHIYETLMMRGIRGTYIYVCDPALRTYLRKYFA